MSWLFQAVGQATGAAPQTIAFGQATETDTATVMAVAPKRRMVNQPSTTETAGVMTPVMAQTLKNNFEAGTDGTAITTSNAGGTGNTNFNVVNTSGAGDKLEFDTAFAHSGTVSLLADSTLTGNEYVEWTTAWTDISTGTIYVRAYVRFVSTVGMSGASKLIRLFDSSAVEAAFFGFDSSRKFRVGDSAGTFSEATVSAGVSLWYRVEMSIPIGNSVTITGRYYYGTHLETNTADEEWTLTSADTLTTAGNIASIRFGNSVAVPVINFDDVGVSAVGWLGSEAPGPTTITVNQATETDTATTFGRAKVKAFAQALETDTGTVFTKRRTKTIGQATETDTATTFTKTKVKAFAQALETDTATVFVRTKRKAFGQSTETDTATTFLKTKRKAFGQATETDTATTFVRTKVKAFGQALETDTATTFFKPRIKLFGQALETDTGRTMTPSKGGRFINQVTETDTAFAITPRRSKAFGLATETDTAFAMTRKKVKAIGIAAEQDTARPFSKIIRVNRVTETDTAFAMGHFKTRTIGQALETDTAPYRYKDIIIATGPLYMWRMEEASGNLVSTPSGLTLVHAGSGATYQVSGIDTYAITKTSSDEYKAASQVLMDSSASVAAWVKSSDFGVSYRGVVGTQNGGFWLGLLDNVPHIYSWADGGDSGTATAINDNQWHHLALTFDGTIGKLYVDGIEKWSGLFGITTPADISDNWFAVGGHAWANQLLAGTIDEAVYWDRVITAGEVATMATPGALRPLRTRTIGQAVETDTATVFVRRKVKAFGQSIETDTATVFSKRKVRSFGQALETDTATHFGSAVAIAFGRAAETDTATVFLRKKTKVFGRAEEFGRNRMPPMSTWTSTGGSPTYDSGTGEWTLPDGASIQSPLVKVDDGILGEVYVDIWTNGVSGEPTFAPLGGILFGTNYFKADGVTPAYNNDPSPGPYQGNGNAQSVPLSVWTRKLWIHIGLGNEVVYVRFSIHNDAYFVGGTLVTRNADLYIGNASFLYPEESTTHLEYPAQAQSVRPRRAHVLGQALETDTSTAFLKRKVKIFGQAIETDTGAAFGKAKRKIFGQALETDFAQPISTAAKKIVAIGQAIETDTATVFGKRKVRFLGQALETDTASRIGRVYLVRLVTETDTATTFGKKKVKAFGSTLEIDTAGAVLPRRNRTFGLATETDTAFAFTKRRTKTIGQATETDTAFVISVLGAKRIPVRQAVEDSSAYAFRIIKKRTLSLTVETDTAFSIAEVKGRILGQVVETDTATSMGRLKRRSVGQALETEQALVFTRRRTRLFGLATETDTAGALSKSKLRFLGKAIESESASAIVAVGGVLTYQRIYVRIVEHNVYARVVEQDDLLVKDPSVYTGVTEEDAVVLEPPILEGVS